MIVLSLDLSFAKTGYAITDISKSKARLIDSGIIIPNKEQDDIPRIIETLKEVEKLYKKYNPDLTLKEKSVIGRSSTATNVIKTHALFEYVYYINTRPYSDIHNGTIKKWARQVVNDKNIDKKLVVAKAIEKYYNKKIDNIWGPRGGLIDDISDAIAITLTYKEIIQ